MIKDGWHNVGNYMVFVEDSKVKRGTDDKVTRTVYPYRWSKKLRCWTIDDGVSLAALRAGINRGTMILH